MVKNNLQTRLRQRAGIQSFCNNNPKIKGKEVANIFRVSPMTVSRWKNRNYFNDKNRKRRTKMTMEVKNFLIRKSKNKFTGIDNASTRKLKLELQKKFG